MTSVHDSLVQILDLERLEHNLFRGDGKAGGRKRIFGGQVIGQALRAACLTVPDRQPHSLHAYFLLPGDPGIPVVYEVSRLRDGRSFATRNVLGIQHGAAIFSMSASFHASESGFSHQMPMPDVPAPENLPGFADLPETDLNRMPAAIGAYFRRERPIEVRPVNLERYLPDAGREPVFSAWIRASAQLPGDPGLHACVLAYASDMLLLDTSLIPHGRSVFDRDMQPASLDHALWFHGPCRADDWLLYTQDSPFSGGARGFARGMIFNRDGGLVASIAQEGLIRHRPDLA